MSTISKSHKLFSERLRNSRVLTTPEDFLGENFEAVLNFWLILDDLSEEELKAVEERQWAFYDENYSEYLKARDLANEASEEVVGWRYSHDSGRSVYIVTTSFSGGWATRELIAMHLILEQQPLTFFEMFLEVL